MDNIHTPSKTVRISAGKYDMTAELTDKVGRVYSRLLRLYRKVVN